MATHAVPAPSLLQGNNPPPSGRGTRRARSIALQGIVGDTEALPVVDIKKRATILTLNDVVAYHPVTTGERRLAARLLAVVRPLAPPTRPPANLKAPSPMLWR
jgi:hypothetical protein